MNVLTEQQRQKLSSKTLKMQVSAFEMAFILELRKHTFGRITAVITNGVPLRVEIGKSIMLLDNEEDMKEVGLNITVKEMEAMYDE